MSVARRMGCPRKDQSFHPKLLLDRVIDGEPSQATVSEAVATAVASMNNIGAWPQDQGGRQGRAHAGISRAAFTLRHNVKMGLDHGAFQQSFRLLRRSPI